ncbi:MAG: glycosyltransferase [Microbacter sp.]
MKKNKKILFVASHLNPFAPSKGGDAQRTHLLIEACSKIGQTDVVCFSKNVVSDIDQCNIIYSHEIASTSKPSTNKLRKWMPVIKFWDFTALFPLNQEKAQVIRRLMEKNDYDFIVTHYLPKAAECGLFSWKDRLIIDVDDLPSDEFLMMAHASHSLSGKIRNFLLSKTAKTHTHYLLKKTRFSFFSNAEQLSAHHSAYLPNIPFYEGKSCPEPDFGVINKRIFFVGDLGYFPNFQGVDYFLKFIYTPLQKKQHDVEFYIAGATPTNSERIKSWEQYPNVKLLGYVDDLQKEYAQSRVVVVPVYKGAGTNIKVIEAMQMHRACVVSKFASRGYTSLFTNREDYFVAHNDAEFIEVLEKLLTNEQLNRQTASNGYTNMKKHYSFSAFLETVKTAFYENSH